MNVDALPFTLLILLAEVAIGGLWVLVASDLRGMVAKSFVKFGAGLILVMAAFTFWVAAKVQVSAEVDGYPLDPAYMDGARIALGVFFALTFPYLYLARRESRQASLVVGGLASAAGLAALALMAQVFAIPTWGYVGTLLSLLVGKLQQALFDVIAGVGAIHLINLIVAQTIVGGLALLVPAEGVAKSLIPGQNVAAQ